jgi:hypothetical protein
MQNLKYARRVSKNSNFMQFSDGPSKIFLKTHNIRMCHYFFWKIDGFFSDQIPAIISISKRHVYQSLFIADDKKL